MSIDQFLFAAINGHGNPLMNTLFIVVSNVVPLVIIVTALFFTRRDKKKIFLQFTLAMIIDFVLTYGLKYMIMRPRPDGVLLLPKEVTPSFPSLHASTVFTWAGFMNFFGKNVYVASVIFAILVGISRIYVGSHYPSDIIFGSVLGYCISVTIQHMSIKKFELCRYLKKCFS
jgi:undecaprenyl-diphosphatase